jgi:cation-transporting ATPase 13A3/4/5
MQPEHKTLLIQCLKKQNKIVAMCGDGVNDVGALRSADVGISLGADQSSASAHFMSSGQDIKCLLKLLCEGKACVSNFLACYKFMLVLCLIKFISCNFLFQIDSILTNNQTILVDLFIILPNSVLISLTKPSTVLSEQRPLYVKANQICITIISHGVIMLVFQIIVYGLMINQNWYRNHDYFSNIFNDYQKTNLTKNQEEINNNNKTNVERNFYDESKIPCFDNTILFFYYYLQCIITIIIFSLYTPFKKDLSENKYLIFYLVGNALFSIYIIFIHNSFIYDFFGLIDLESQNFKFTLLVVAIINFFVSLYTEKNLLKYEEEKNEEKDVSIPNNSAIKN